VNARTPVQGKSPLVKWLFWGIFLALCSPCHRAEAPAVRDAAGEHAIELGLRAIKMTARDLGFQKTNIKSELILGKSKLFLQEPLRLSGYAHSVFTNCAQATSLRKLTGFAFRQLEIAPPTLEFNHPAVAVDLAFLAKLPAQVAQAVQEIAAAASLGTSLLRQSLPTNGAAALASFAQGGLHLEKDIAEMDSWRQFGIDTEPLKRFLELAAALSLQDTELPDAILCASDQFDPRMLLEVSLNLAGAVDEAIVRLRTNKSVDDFQLETDTELGKIIVGGTGQNVYKNEAFMIIDLGGDDTYMNCAGGANGFAGRQVSIVIDLGGDDQYISRASFAQGSGVFGIGILVDCGGDDIYEAKHLSQGVGFFGCGILKDYGGLDKFVADTFAQGAGMFGTGILWQGYGDTTYEAAHMAQGFGGVQGVGLLLDESGDECYLAGGKYPCDWLPGRYFSLSQGFGFGMRPYAGGGIGILCDLKGDDHYKADVYGQGASYWYSVGLLLDADGNDIYNAYQYCQGAGIHLSTGALIDWIGDDAYSAHAICQGSAHDYSVGMLIERAGNDKYTGNMEAQGAAINNSFALLLDHAGDDSYTATEPDRCLARGHSGETREYGSIALMLDLAGKDNYPQGHSNNGIWLKPMYGAGLDTESAASDAFSQVVPPEFPLRTGGVTPPGRLYAVGPVDPQHPIEHLFRRAISDQPDASKAWEEVKQRAAEVLPYLVNRISSPNLIYQLKFGELVDHLNTDSIPLLIAGLRQTQDEQVAGLCCFFLARFDEIARPAIPAVLPLLKRDRTRATAFYTLGHMRAAEAFSPAMEALDADQELVRLRATQALGRIGDRRATACLIRKLDDEVYTVRYAAVDALVAFGKPSISPLAAAYRDASDRARPHLLEALAKLGDERALSWGSEFYKNETALVRDAVLGLLETALTKRTHGHP